MAPVLTQVLVAINIALLVCMISGALTVYQDLAPRIARMQQLIPSTIASPTSAPQVPPEMTKLVRDVLEDVSGTFLFGAVNGSLPQFLGDMLRPEVYAQLAEVLVPFAGSVLEAFDHTPATVCQDVPVITCEQYGEVQCNNTGAWVMCEYPGQIINCATAPCIATYVYAVASLISSVGSRIAELQGPSQPSNSNAAFSSGLLNIEGLVGWVQGQTNIVDWRSAGNRCLDLTARVNAIDWSGSYVKFNGDNRAFNATKGVERITSYVDQVCQNIVDLVDKIEDRQR